LTGFKAGWRHLLAQPLVRLIAFPFLLIGSGLWLINGVSAAKAGSSPSHSGAVPAMYSTQAEAEAAAAKFGCKGAHRMGTQWMPCAEHPGGGSAGHPAAGH
jgi:hypothetical protein